MSHGITVLICSYNHNEYLQDAINSVMEQTRKPDEILIVDDGSDIPVQIDAGVGARIIRHDQNMGLAAARNTGIKNAQYPFIALLDSDDRWEPEKLAAQHALMLEAGPEIFGIFTQFRRIGRAVRAGVVGMPEIDDWYRFFLMGIRSGPGSTLMFRRDAALACEPYDVRMRRYEDWDWLLNVTRSGKYSFLNIAEPMASVLLSGRPSPQLCTEALDLIEERHTPQLRNASERRLFSAAVNIERSAISRWQGKKAAALLYALRALKSPELIKRELKLTLSIS